MKLALLGTKITITKVTNVDYRKTWQEIFEFDLYQKNEIFEGQKLKCCVMSFLRNQQKYY
jgi:hypothetical protein